MRSDGRTDGHDEANSRFSQLWKRSQKIQRKCPVFTCHYIIPALCPLLGTDYGLINPLAPEFSFKF